MNEYVGELKMKEPLTKEDWDIIADTDFKHTSKVTFTTPHCGEVEFVKVVRCKDCKQYDESGWGFGECHLERWGDGWANYPPPSVPEDGFCKWGKRSEEECEDENWYTELDDPKFSERDEE